MINGQQTWYASEICLDHQIIVDVGANRGALSQFFWQQSRGTSTVISIEPLPQNYKHIRKIIERSKAQNWLLEACAISDCSGEITMTRLHSREHGWNSMVADSHVVASGLKTLSVPCKTLSDIAPQSTVIKMDIEGHEYAVLDHALKRLSHVHTWAVELHMLPDRPLEGVITQFNDQNFQVIAAGYQPGAHQGKWHSIPVYPQLHWDQIPITRQSSDGRVFKMLHIIAKRA